MIAIKILTSIALAILSMLFAFDNTADKSTNDLSKVFSFFLILAIFFVWE